MADQHPQGHEKEPAMKDDCGIFAFLGKNEEKPQEEDKPILVEELHRSHSSSSSSSDEEGGEGKKKKKGLKKKIKDKMVSRGDEVTEHKDSPTAVEKHEEVLKAETAHPEEKKGILEKIKEKLPGQHKKDEEEGSLATPPEGEPKEKKGILEKIKEKLPGHNKNGEDAKEKHN